MMSEYEKLIRAQKYMEMLANGIHPVENTEIPETDVIHDVRITRCLFYVSGLLQSLIRTEQQKTDDCLTAADYALIESIADDAVSRRKKRGRNAREDFCIPEECIRNIPLSETAVSASMLVRCINSVIASENMKRLTYQHLTTWLKEIGVLTELINEDSGKRCLVPTEDGIMLGIRQKTREKKDGSVVVYAVYSRRAQQFVIDNLEAVSAVCNET